MMDVEPVESTCLADSGGQRHIHPPISENDFSWVTAGDWNDSQF